MKKAPFWRFYTRDLRKWYAIGDGWEASWVFGKDVYVVLRHGGSKYVLEATVHWGLLFFVTVWALSFERTGSDPIVWYEKRPILEKGVDAVRMAGQLAFIKGDPPPNWYRFW